MEGKRKFPYYSAVESFEVKKAATAGSQYHEEHGQPRVFQQRLWNEDDNPVR